MSNRNRAAVDVDKLIGNAELVAAVDDLAGKGFIEFPQTDVVDLEPVAFQQLGHREYRSDSHLVGLDSGDRHPAIHSQRMQPALLGLFALHQNAGRGPVRKLARVAGGDESARPLSQRQTRPALTPGSPPVSIYIVGIAPVTLGPTSFI